jgi:hypothetical protein
MNKLWCTCSSNQTHFQLIWQNFVFFMRAIWKSLDTQRVDEPCIKYDLLFYKNILVQLNIIYLVVISQKKPSFDTRKIENELFIWIKGKYTIWRLFAIPSRTHVHNMVSFKKIMLWFCSWPSSSSLKTMKLRIR